MTERVMSNPDLSDDQVFALIKSLNDRFNGKGVRANNMMGGGAATSWAGRIIWRRGHLHNLPFADPILTEPWDDGAKAQSDLPRKVYTEMVSRLTENPVTFDISSPKENDKETSDGDDFATVLREGWLDIQERLQINIQEAISGGQVGEAFGLLHWRIDHEMMPPVPEQLPGESDKTLQERTAILRAESGFPVYVECPDISGYMWSEDRTMRGGDATGCLARQVGMLEYVNADGSDDQGIEDEELSIEEQDAKIPIGEERDAPRRWMPSWVNWDQDDIVTVYEFWTRNEFYEVVDFSGDGSQSDGWVVRKSFKHPYEMPPFIRVPAVVYNVADPILKYEPYLEGVYRIKPFADRLASLLAVMAEKAALPYFYWRNLKDGAPKLAEDGTTVIKFSQDSAAANIAPPGYELVKAEEATINPAFVQLHVQTRDEMKDAAPPTGRAEVTASTQPFAIKFQQEQASIILRAALRNQVSALKVMWQNIIMLMGKSADEGGIGDTVYRFRSTQTPDGTRIVDRTKAIGVAPEKLANLTLNVNISGTSQAEQTTKIQIGIQLLNDPNVPLTKVYVLKDYFGIEAPEDAIAQWRAENTFDTKILPGLVDRELAKTFGSVFVLSPDGQAVGFGGQAASPQDVLQKNGFRPAVPPQAQGQPQAPLGAPGAPPSPPPINMPAATFPQVQGMMPTPSVPA